MKMPKIEVEFDTKAFEAMIARMQVVGDAITELATEAEKAARECSEKLAEIQRKFALEAHTAMENVDWPAGLSFVDPEPPEYVAMSPEEVARAFEGASDRGPVRLSVAEHPQPPRTRLSPTMYTEGVLQPVLVEAVLDTRREDILLTDDERGRVSDFFAASPGNRAIWLVPSPPKTDGDADMTIAGVTLKGATGEQFMRIDREPPPTEDP